MCVFEASSQRELHNNEHRYLEYLDIRNETLTVLPYGLEKEKANGTHCIQLILSFLFSSVSTEKVNAVEHYEKLGTLVVGDAQVVFM